MNRNVLPSNSALRRDEFQAVATLVALAVCLLALAFVSGSAQAQLPDHMKCYKIKDPLALAGVVDLEGPQFGIEAGCKIGATKYFCVPVTKHVVQAADTSTKPPTPITPMPITAAAAPGDQICYSIRCSKPFPPDTDATDQFGRRTLQKLTPSLLCGPAVKGPPPPPVACVQANAPACNGVCTDPTQICAPTATDGCTCQPATPCGGTAPQCNGSCPAATPHCVPVQSAAGVSCGCK